MAKYNILVGVKLDSNSLSSLKNKLANRKDIKVPIGVKVDNASLKAIKKQISDSKIKAVKLNLDTSSAKKKIATIRRQIEQLSNIKIDLGAGRSVKSSGLEKEASAAKKVESAYKDAKGAKDRFNSSSSKTGSQDAEKIAKQIAKTAAQMDKLEASVGKLKGLSSSLKSISNTTSNKSIIGGVTEARREISDLGRMLSELRAKSQAGILSDADIRAFEAAVTRAASKVKSLKDVSSINMKIETGQIGAEVDKVVRKMNKLDGASDEVRRSVKQMTIAFSELQGAKNIEEMIRAYERLIVAKRKAESAISFQSTQDANARATSQMLMNAKSLELSKQKLELDIKNWLKNNSAATRDFGVQLNTLIGRIKSCDAAGLKNLRSEFQLVQKEAELSGVATLNAFDQVKKQAKRYASYFLVSSVAFAGIYKLKEMFQNAVAVDTQMTELYRVTDLTTSQYSDLYDKLTDSAQKYGAVLTDLIGATADWSRSGFDANTAARLAEITTMYEHIADVDYQTAYENLMTSYKGFEGQIKEQFGNDSAAAVGYIADILNEFDNNYAVTAAGVGEGLQRAASALSVADNTIQETAAMVGGITEVTQDPEKAGNALKVVSMRLRGMKGELEDLGEETDENVENISKMQGQILNLTHGKVNIFGDDGEFKSTYEIMQGIANVWEDLNSIEQADLLETISGKHRANDVASLLSNWENVEKMVVSATEATGSASREYEKYINSLQGHLNKLTSAFQTLSATAVNKGLFNGIIDGITGVINVLNMLIDTIGILPTLAGIVTAALSFTRLKERMPFQAMTSDIMKFSDLFSGLINNVKLFGLSFKEIGSSIGSMVSNLKSMGLPAIIKQIGEGGLIGLGKNVKGSKSGSVFTNSISLFSDEYIKKQKADIDAIKKFRETALKDPNITPEQNLKMNMANASYNAQQWAQSSKAVKDFAKSEDLATVATAAQNKSMKDTIGILNLFKNGFEGTNLTYEGTLNKIKEFDPVMANYIDKTDKSKLSWIGLTAAQVSAKAATIGLEIATMALNAALSMGISILIGTLISAITKYVNRASEIAEKADEITASFEEQSNSAKNAKSVIDDVGESYERLSKGVNSVTGKNESLSSEEYEEYLQITNQIADAMPSLVSGFDSQGNAILSCRGSLEALNEEYKKMQQAANDSVLGGAGTIFEDFENKVKKASGSNFKDANIWTRLLGFDFDNDLDMESYEALSKTLDATSGSIAESADKYLASVKPLHPSQLGAGASIVGSTLPGAEEYAAMIDNANEIASELEKLGYEKTLTEKFTRDNASFVKRILTETPKAGQDILKAFEATVEPLAEDMRNVAEAHISNAFLSGDYTNISEDMQTMIESMVPNLSYDFFADFIDKDGNFNTTKFYAELNSILSTFNDLEPLKRQKFETFFNLQTEYNNGEVTTGEYFRSIEEINSIISTLDPEVQENIKITMGLDESSINEVQYDYNKLINDLVESGATEDVAKKFADGLTSKEITTAINLVASNEIDIKNLDINQFKKKVQELTELDEAISFELDIDIRTEELDKLKDAVAESVSGAGLSTESISVVEQTFGWMDTYDPSKLFERTANGLRLNTDELKKMNAEYKEYNSNGLEDKLSALATKYNKTKSDLANLTYGTDEYYSKLNELDSIESQINATEQLAAQYEGLTSAYNEWIMAEDAGSQRDMYEKVIEGFENVEDEISRGWYDDATVEFIEMLSGKDLSSGNINKIKSAWKSLGKTIEGTNYSVKDFFTVNEDGDSTNTGVYNFLEAVDSKFKKNGVIQKDGSGNIIGFDFKVAGGDEAIAEALGVSEELVQIMVRAADDAGFVVSMDGTYQQLDVLKEKAEEAAKTLKEMFKGTENEITTNFNLNTDNEQDLKAQYDSALAIWNKFKEIKNADGTVNMNVAGAEEAFTLVSTLQTMLDQLSEPVYMDIETSEVSKELQEPLTQLQEYERLTQQEHQLNLKGTDTSSLQESKNEILNYLEGLDPTIKANLGIEGLSKDELQKKVEAGEVKIPATIDLQVETNNTLRDMINVSLYNSGLITKEELEKRVDVNVYADKIDTTSAEQQTNEAVENSVGQTTTVDKSSDVNVDAGSVDTSQAEETINEAVDDSAKNIQNVETEVDANVNVETVNASVDEVKSATEELASNIEKIEDKDVTINVTVNGLDDVKELNENIELATSIDGNVDALSDFANAAKKLDGVSNNIVKNVSASLYGNLNDNDNLDSLQQFIEGAKNLEGVESSYVTITTNVNGNLYENVANIDLLPSFAKGAKALEGASSSDVSVKANLEANIGGFLGFNPSLNNVEKFANAAKSMQGISSSDVSVRANLEANIGGFLGYKPSLDNLNRFIDSAEKIEGVSSSDVSVKANLEANVGGFLGYNSDLNNLDKFADSAERLGEVADASVSVNAELNANVGGIFGYNPDLNNLDKFAESAKKFKDIENVDVTVKAHLFANVGGLFGYNADLNNIDRFTESAKKLKNVENADVTVKATLEANIGGFLGYNPSLDNLDKFAESAKKLKDVEDLNVTVKAHLIANTGGFLGNNPDLNNLDRFISGAKKLENVKNSDVTAKATLEANTGGFLGFNPDLNNLDKFADAAKKLSKVKDSDVTVKAKLEANTGGILGYNPDLDNLNKFADAAKKLSKVKNSDVTAKAKLETNVDKNEAEKLDVFADAAKKLEEAQSSNVTIKAKLKGEINEDVVKNLSSFADGAKKLQGVGDAEVNITANLSSSGLSDNIFGSNSALDNLDKFAESAKKFKDVEDADVNISANLESTGVSNNIFGSNSVLDNLDRFTKSAKKMKDVEDADVNISASLKSTGVSNNIFGSNSVLDNLDRFTKSAKKMKDVEDSSVSITANLKSTGVSNNIFGSNSALDNLDRFTKSAKQMKNVEDVSVSITANLKSSGVSDNIFGSNSVLDNLGKFTKAAKSLKDVEDVDVSITANLKSTGVSNNIFGSNSTLDNLTKFTDAAKKLQNVEGKTVSVEANLKGNLGDTNTAMAINNLPSFSSIAGTLQNVESSNVTVTANIEGGITNENVATLSNFSAVTSSLPKSTNVTVTTSVDIDGINSAKNTLQSLSDSGVMHGYNATVTVSTNVDSSAVDNYQPSEKTGIAKYKVDSSNVKAWKPDPKKGKITYTPHVEALTESQKNKTGTITYKAKIEGSGGPHNGTATPIGSRASFASGSAGKAFAQGDWGVKGSGVALGGELGQELVVRNGRWFTIGDNGAEFFKYQPNDIIFNAGQTKQLFEQGKLVGGRTRGMIANANGTAFSEGTAFAKGKKNSNAEIAREMEKARDWFYGITDAQVKNLGYKNIKTVKQFYKAIENGTINPNFGNINMDNREVIKWNKTNKEKYKKGLKSWGHYSEVGSGDYDTVYGAANTYGVDIDGKGVVVAYSPIVVDKNGKATNFLARESVNSYIENIVRKAYEQDGKFKQSTILSLDNLGIIAGADTTIPKKNDWNGTGNTAVVKSALMHFAGKYGAIQQAKKNNKKSKYDGSAFARGTLQYKDTETALGGELGTEILVRDGRWYTIGDNGAEFFGHKKNDIIFNAEQSKQLLEKGKISNGNGRGSIANANGTAFASGKAFEGGSTGKGGGGKVDGGYYKPKSKSTSKSKSGSSDDDFLETFDWIEVKIERIERRISNLDKKANNTYKSWSYRNKQLTKEIDEINNEIEKQKQARDYYKKSADNFDLDEKWKNKVKNGKIKIEDIDNKELAEAIKKFQELWEKYLNSKDKLIDLNEDVAEKMYEKFENVAAEFEGYINVIKHRSNLLEQAIAFSEASGYVTSTKYYDALIANENRTVAALMDEKAALENKMAEAVSSGIEEGSEKWYDMQNQINSVTEAIAEANVKILEFKNNIREIEWNLFDMLQDDIAQITQEADFLVDLMSRDNLYDDKGQFNDKGLATAGLRGVNYNTYMEQADKYGEEIAEIDSKIAKKEYDKYDQNVLNRRKELLKLQQESILKAEQEKDAIKDLVEEGIELELDSLEKLIDKYTDALDSQKDLYDYQKKVKDQTKEIASLEKQMAAYAGDDSEESKAKIQKLKVDLEDAREDLEETEYDKYISDQKKLLDDLYNDYEETINKRLDNIDGLVSTVIADINANGVSIKKTLEEEVKSVGTVLSGSMNTIWGHASPIMSGIYNSLSTQDTGVSDAVEDIYNKQQGMMQDIDNIASGNISNIYDATPAPPPPSSSTTTTTTTKKTTTTTKKSTTTKKATPQKGDTVKISGNAPIYVSSDSNNKLTQYYKNDPVYVVGKTVGDKVQLTYHKEDGKEVTGWFNTSDVKKGTVVSTTAAKKSTTAAKKSTTAAKKSTTAAKKRAAGKRRIESDEISWTQEKGPEFIVRPSDGAILTPLAKGDSVLNAAATGNIWNMANNPSEFIKNNLGVGVVESNASQYGSSACTQNFENISFVFPNVKNYDQMLAAMQKDKNFERLISAMTIDQVAGKSSLGKGKAIR